MSYLTHIEIGATTSSTLMFLRVYSHFDEELGKRVISKKEMSAVRIEENTVGRSRNSIYKDLKQIKKDGILQPLEGQKNIFIVQDPVSPYAELPGEFYKQLLRTFNAQTCNVYFWLWGRKQIRHDPCYFAYKDIVEDCLGMYYDNRTCNLVREIINQLKINGLILVRRVVVGQTGLWNLISIRTQFAINDIINAAEDQFDKELGINEEYVGDIDGLEQENVIEGYSVGYADSAILNLTVKKAPALATKVQSESSSLGLSIVYGINKPACSFVSVKDSLDYMKKNMNRSNMTVDDLINYLGKDWAEGQNDEVIEYLKSGGR